MPILKISKTLMDIVFGLDAEVGNAQLRFIRVRSARCWPAPISPVSIQTSVRLNCVSRPVTGPERWGTSVLRNDRKHSHLWRDSTLPRRALLHGSGRRWNSPFPKP